MTKWLTSGAVAQLVNRSSTTVRRAAEGDLLHGHQPVDGKGRAIPNGRWSFHPASVDAWVQGRDLRAQQQACGCPTVRAVPAGRRPA